MSSELEVMKAIPGYKAIFKALLKSQIQLLVEQMSEHVGEECIVLTANVTDGSLSHLGSDKGRHFIAQHAEIKTKFLGYCISDDQSAEKPVRSSYTKIKSKHKLGHSHSDHEQSDNMGHFPNKKHKSHNQSNTSFNEPKNSKLRTEQDGDLYGHSNNINDVSDGYNGDDGEVTLCKVKTEVEEEDLELIGVEAGNNPNVDTMLSQSDQFMDGPCDISSSDTHHQPAPHLEFLSHLSSNINHQSYATNLSTHQHMPASLYLTQVHGDTTLNHSESEADPLAGYSTDILHSSSELSPLDQQKGYSGDQKGYTCDVCMRVFTRQYNMKQHRMLHFGVKQYSCDKCDKQFTRQDRLKYHHMKHHSDGKFQSLFENFDG